MNLKTKDINKTPNEKTPVGCYIVLIIAVACLIGYCSKLPKEDVGIERQTIANNAYLKSAKDKEKRELDSIAKISISQPKLDTAYLNLVTYVNKAFLKSIKDFDKDSGEDNFSRLNKILKKHKTTIYALYLELSEMKKNAVSVARANGMEIRANGTERVLNNYFSILKNEKRVGEINFKRKYGFDNRLLQVFENNYCSCYTSTRDSYFSDGRCKLINGEFWE